MSLNSIEHNRLYDSHIPYALLEGTPFEIGLKHGQIASNQIAKNIEIYSKLYKETSNVSWSQARERASKFLPLLESKYPEILEELNGISKGTNDKFDLLDILTLNVRSEISLVKLSDGCTSLAQRSTNGDVIVGQNWDWLKEIDETTILLEIHELNKPKIIILAEAGIIGKYGFNSSGISIMLNAIGSNFVDFNKLPIHFALRKAYQFDNIDEIINYLSKVGVASAANYLIGDVNNYISLEVSPRGFGIVKPDPNTNTVYHTNHFIDPTLSNIYPRDKPLLSSGFRYDRIKQTSINTTGSFKSFKQRLYDEENTPKSIKSPFKPEAVGLERCSTLYTIIINNTKKEGILTIASDTDDKEYKLFFAD